MERSEATGGTPTTAEPPELWYLRVDVAGASNTWAVALRRQPGGPVVGWGPAKCTLQAVVDWARQHRVLAVAIDGQLTASLADENGFRACDRAMRASLGSSGFVNWVASFNSLMAVPVRGRMLAEALSPFVGTVLETHPRFSLWSALDEGFDHALGSYKIKNTPSSVVSGIVAAWSKEFNVRCPQEIVGEGALDALVCATVAMLFHESPERLSWPLPAAGDVRGAGPFVAPKLSSNRASTVDTLSPVLED
jgi:predicted nuclease with RNAse H fold